MEGGHIAYNTVVRNLFVSQPHFDITNFCRPPRLFLDFLFVCNVELSEREHSYLKLCVLFADIVIVHSVVILLKLWHVRVIVTECFFFRKYMLCLLSASHPLFPSKIVNGTNNKFLDRGRQMSLFFKKLALVLPLYCTSQVTRFGYTREVPLAAELRDLRDGVCLCMTSQNLIG